MREPQSMEDPDAPVSEVEGGFPSPRMPVVDGAMEGLSRHLGCTVGQAYTLVVGLSVALAASLLGIPPALDAGEASQPRVTGAQPSGNSGGGSTGEVPPEGPAVTGAPQASTAGGDVTASGATRSSPAGRTSGSDDEPSGSSDDSSPPRGGPAFPDGGSLGEIEIAASVPGPGAPEGIAVRDDGGFVVGTNNGGDRGKDGPSQVLSYSPFGVLQGTHQVAGQPTDREQGITGLVHDGEGRLYALDASTGRVLQVDVEEGTQRVYAEIPDVPPCLPDPTGARPCGPTLSEGPADLPPLPRAAAFDADGALYVTDAAQAIIWRIGSGGGEPEAYHAAEDYSSPDGLAGIAVDGDGDLVFAVSMSTVGGTGAVYLLDVAADGSPGQRTELYRGLPDESPRGLAIGESARVYVTLFGANRLLILGSDGSEKARVPEPGEPGEGEDNPFDGPAGLVFRGSSVLITNQSPQNNDPVAWAVLRAPVEDRGLRP